MGGSLIGQPILLFLSRHSAADCSRACRAAVGGYSAEAALYPEAMAGLHLIATLPNPRRESATEAGVLSYTLFKARKPSHRKLV
jgi:hypothetical protein